MESKSQFTAHSYDDTSTAKFKDDDGSDGNDNGSSASEEIEPKFKYMRMTNDVQNILKNDAASCLVVHAKFVCIGSQCGMVHLLDHQGNSVRKELYAHKVAVNQISIDDNGDFIASCSDDGKVFIYSLYSTESNQSIETGRLVKSIAMDPNYYKSSSCRRFITGDERLVLHEETFLSRSKLTVLCDAEGGVQNIKWKGRFVAWASDIGVRVYDMYARVCLGLIKWSLNPQNMSTKYRCNLCWSTPATLLVGWVDTIRICVIRKRSPLEFISSDLPEYLFECVSTFYTDFLVCGLGPLDNQLVVLGYPKEVNDNGKTLCPQLYVIEPREEDYFKLRTYSLSLREYQKYKCNDYHLVCLIEENRFFIVSPKEIVVASPCDANDRIQWLIEHGKFETAMNAVSQFEGRDLKRHTPLEVGRVFLDHLLSEHKYDKAAKLCLKILGKDKRLWEEEVFKFARVQQLGAVSKYLPIGDHALNPHIYEMVLYELLKTDAQAFLNLVKGWPPVLYHVTTVVNAVVQHLLHPKKDKLFLLEALAILYSHEKKYVKAMAIYLKLRHKNVFQLIHKYNLHASIHDMIENLMELDCDQALALLLEKDRFSPDVVVEQLQYNKIHLYMYLDALERRDVKQTSKKYHNLLVGFYAEFSQEKLLPFLRRSDQYSIQEALNICKEKVLYPEMVYLLDFMGNRKEALVLIMQKLNNIEHAIEFCKKHDDVELWDHLIDSAVKNPMFVKFLLENICSYVYPRKLIRKIENGLPIPGLQSSLMKMMHDFNLQVAVQEDCWKILVSDYFNLHERLVHLQQKGILVNDEQVCGGCHRKIINKDIRRASNVIMFYCRHSFHEECLPTLGSAESCMICHPVSQHVKK